MNTYIGDGSFFNFGCVFLDVCPIRIGSTVLVGNNVQFLTPTHPLNPVDRAAYWEGGEPITVEDNVWIGGGAIILGGVTIGKNSVIGAGTVVTKDVPANSSWSATLPRHPHSGRERTPGIPAHLLRRSPGRSTRLLR